MSRPPGADDLRTAERPLRTLFFGSGAFALPILGALRTLPQLSVVGVVSAPERPAGRGRAEASTPVAGAARELGLRLLQPSRLRDPEATAAIAALGPQLGVLADYGRIVPAAILDLPERGFLNVHPSLLPRHRGASPIPAMLLAGDSEAGVSIIEMGTGVDDGPVVAQARIPLASDASAVELEARLAELGAEVLLDTLAPWLAGTQRGVPQDETAATLTKPLSREDGRLDPALGAAALERRVRALQPWPGAFIDVAAGRLNVDSALVRATGPEDRPGMLVADGDGLALATADGRLRLGEVRLAGTRRMSGAELRRGRPGLVGLRVSSRG